MRTSKPDAWGTPLTVSRKAARRFLLRRSGLGRAPGEPGRWPSPVDTAAAVRSLEYVQVDPMSVLARSADLVLGARVSGYRPEVLDGLLYRERALVEVVGAERMIVPVEDYPLFRLHFAAVELRERPQVTELEPVMREALARIEAEGPLSSIDFDDDRRVPGWWDGDGEPNTKAVRQALEWLWHFGRLAICRREGLRRYFDLPERVHPGLEPLRDVDGRAPLEAYRTGVALKYFRAMGLSNPRAWHFGWSRRPVAERLALAEVRVAAGELVPVRVEGVERLYLAPAAEAGDLASAESWEPAPEARFLAPLDNVIWDRQRLAELWGFDYTWEAYVPAAKRKYGPYTCPILWGDSLAGRIDARVDRAPEGGLLVVNGLWWEKGADRPPAPALRAALEEWARLNGASALRMPRGGKRAPRG